MLSVGASQGIILYDPDETWAIATVVTLCGLHRALPVAAGLHQPATDAVQPDWFPGLIPWLHAVWSQLARHFGYQPEIVHQGNGAMPEQQDHILDTRGMWKDSLQATTWAYDHLFTKCKHTSEMIAVQVYSTAHPSLNHLPWTGCRCCPGLVRSIIDNASTADAATSSCSTHALSCTAY